MLWDSQQCKCLFCAIKNKSFSFLDLTNYKLNEKKVSTNECLKIKVTVVPRLKYMTINYITYVCVMMNEIK